ncbi:MAG: CBS domain-containing protein [Myxococcales bacterium]|nr:CBS domain-containing protein [Myxococcales bacterium]
MKLSALTVRDIMSEDVETLDPNDDVDLAEMFMRLDNLHHFPVVDGGQVVGVISHRDVAHHSVSPSSSGMAIEARRQLNLRIKVKDVMTTDVRLTSPDTSILDAAEAMKSGYLGCLPVIEDDALVGIVTGTDLLALLIRAIRND